MDDDVHLAARVCAFDCALMPDAHACAGKQLFVGNPAEVRRHVNPDSKQGKEIMERLDRLQGCFDRVHYAPETYDSGKTNFHSDTKQQEYRTKYGTSYAFGSKVSP